MNIEKEQLATMGLRFFTQKVAGDKFGTYKDYIRGIDQKVPWKCVKKVTDLRIASVFDSYHGKKMRELIHSIEIYKPLEHSNSKNSPVLWFALCAGGKFMMLSRNQRKEFYKLIYDKEGDF